MSVTKENRYLFTVIVPVYNKREFLREAIDSIVNQSIGFENIQLILIDDGSDDGSGDLCAAIAREYPENVLFIAQENQGVSAARNRGLSLATGRYINFFDADDIWDLKAFETALRMLESHESEIDMVAARVIQFNEKGNFKHPLDYVYKKSGVVSLYEHPDYIHPMIGDCFFKSRALEGKRFNENIAHSEDTLLLNGILLDKCAYAVFRSAKYRYRRGELNSSPSRSTAYAHTRDEFSVCLALYAESKARYGFIQPFILQLALYKLCWNILLSPEQLLDEDQKKEWRKAAFDLLQPITVRMIRESRWLSSNKRLYLLMMKCGITDAAAAGGLPAGLKMESNGKVYYEGAFAYNLNSLNLAVVDIICEERDNLLVEGRSYGSTIDAAFKMKLSDSRAGWQTYASLSPDPSGAIRALSGETALCCSRFSFRIPIAEKPRYDLTLTLEFSNGVSFTRMPMLFTVYGRLDGGRSYTVCGDTIVKYNNNSKKLKIMPYRLRTHAASELRKCRWILGLKKNLKLKARWRIVFIRLASQIYKKFKRKPIWMFIDREYKAGDNAEALYSYALQHVDAKDVSMFFALEKNSADYPRLHKMGKIIEPYSIPFQIRFLAADKLLSSHFDGAVTNPFGKNGKYFSNLYQYRFYYLSHGTLQGDLSKLLNKHARPIYRFMVDSSMEKEALTQDDYGFRDEEIVPAGMCRYDAYNPACTQKKIVFLPTWRSNLAGKIIPGSRKREFIDDFEESDYCRAYNSLINDERLIGVLKKHGFVGEFYVHPNYEKQISCFHGNDTVKVGDSSADYTKVLSEAAILVSDYSGVAFDFAYMRKPVVYYQFDDLFSGDHTYQSSYFDYAIDGFGPVCYDRESAIDAIERLLAQNCEMPEAYRRRADNFFIHSDHHNSARALAAVLAEDTIE